MDTGKDVNIFYLDKANIANEALKAIASKLDVNVSETSYHDQSSYENHLLGLWLIARATGMTDQYATLKSTIQREKFGKPFISSNIHFNVAHSHNLIVCAITLHGALGIDIEHRRPIPWAEYKNSFTDVEWDVIMRTAHPHDMVLNYWTKKESLLKADGRGLQEEMCKVVIHGNQGWIEHEPARWHIRQLSIHPDYHCHFAATFQPDRITIIRENLD